MALAIDATSSGSAITSVQTSKTWAHTCAGSDRLIYAPYAGYCDSGQQPTAETYAAAASTKVAESSRSSGGDIAQIWRRIAPATGANNNVLTFPTSNVGGCSAISFTGGHQTTPEGTPSTNIG